MKKIIIILLIGLLILSACSSKNKITGNVIKNNNSTGIPITGAFAVDKNICIIINDGAVSSVLNRHCNIDSDCYGLAKASGVTDMGTVKCS